jgi:cell division protein FtsL
VGVLAALMFGIVALNVAALRGSIDVSKMRGHIQQLEQQNGLLRNQTISLSNPYAIGRKARGYGMVPANATTTKHVRLSKSSGGRPAP